MRIYLNIAEIRDVLKNHVAKQMPTLKLHDSTFHLDEYKTVNGWSCEFFDPNGPTTLTPKEIDTAKTQGKISCIKMVRNRTNLGLREVKELVEKEAEKLGIEFFRRQY